MIVDVHLRPNVSRPDCPRRGARLAMIKVGPESSRCRSWSALAASFLLALATSVAADRHPPLSPAESLSRFQLEVGLRIELVVAEPLVINPVAFAFDGPRRLFVVEGRGYPDAIEGGSKTTEGRIALLEDPDGDGRFDRRKEF